MRVQLNIDLALQYQGKSKYFCSNRGQNVLKPGKAYQPGFPVEHPVDGLRKLWTCTSIFCNFNQKNKLFDSSGNKLKY